MKRILLALTLASLVLAAVQAKDRPRSLGIGDKVPDLKLVDDKGKKHSLFEGLKGKEVLVLGFYSYRCPYNVAYWDSLAALSKEYKAKGVRFLGVNANRKESLADVRQGAGQAGVSHPVYRDEDLSVTDALGGLATPHMMVIDSQRVLRYRGAVDDGRGDDKKATTPHLKAALDAVLAGKPVPEAEPDAFIGCTIKR